MERTVDEQLSNTGLTKIKWMQIYMPVSTCWN